MSKKKKDIPETVSLEDSVATVSAPPNVTISSAVFAELLDRQARSNADLLERVLAKFTPSLDSMAASVSISSESSSIAPVISTTKIKVPKYSDDDSPNDYFTKYEQAMSHNGEPRSQWGQLLPLYLSGKAQASFNEIPTEVLNDYDTVKNALLNSLGDTPSNAGRRWWTLARQPGETYNSLYLRVYSTNLRRLDGVKERQAIIDRLDLSRFMSLLPYDCFNFVFSRNPKTGREASDFATEFAQTRSFAKRHNHDRYGSHHTSGVAGQHSRSNSSRGQNTEDSHKNPPAGEHVPRVAGNESQGVQSSDSSKDKSGSTGDYNNKSGRKFKPIVCHNCGEPGHIRPNCPNRVKRVSSPTLENGSSKSNLFVSGFIDDTPSDSMFIDSGCEVTCVAKHLVPESAYTGRSTLLKGYKASSQPEPHPIAKVRLRLFSYDKVIEAAVVDDITEDVLLGSDLGRSTLAEWLIAAEASSKSVKLTRAQANFESAQETNNQVDLEASGASPHLLTDIFNFSSEFFDEQPINATSMSPESVTLPLPTVTEDPSDKELLITQQKSDPSLNVIRQLADKQERGYEYANGVLVHTDIGHLAFPVKQVVLPLSRRPIAMKYAHSSDLSGHCGVKRTLKRLYSCVTWPNISRDVRKYVQDCGPCQKQARCNKSKAPLHPLPIVGTPFKRIAFDLVGPYPCTSKGHKYILTSICYFSRYPEAIPLKKVDEQSVATAMIEIFSRSGIPSEILTDQGSVFMGKLMSQLCSMLGIKPIRTSPYHPQTDGLLERWHSDLLAMLKKAASDKKDWDLYLPYVLFAYRQTPHTVTGFSPFQLIYGFNVRGPLEILRDNWIDGCVSDMNLIEWVEQLRMNLLDFSVIAGDRTALAKCKMKKHYDKSSSLNSSLMPGLMVLVRTPGLSSKFSDSWEGPFELLRQGSILSCRISKPHSNPC